MVLKTPDYRDQTSHLKMIDEIFQESMKDKLRRFNEALEQAKRECCIWCPCAEGCDKIPEEDNTPCETILFLYVETGETENFSKYFEKTLDK